MNDLPALGLDEHVLSPSTNRRDAAYMAVSTAMQIAIRQGVHKGWSVDEANKRDILDDLTVLIGKPDEIKKILKDSRC